MKTWEIDIEMRVRKTLSFSGPSTEEAAREIVAVALSGGINMRTIVKWEGDNSLSGRHPVETIIDNDPRIVAVREVLE